MKEPPEDSREVSMQFSLRKLFFVVALCGVAAWVVTAVVRNQQAREQHRNTLHELSTNDWPRNVAKLISSATKQNIQHGMVKISYCPWSGYYLCELEESPKFLAFMTQEVRLVPATRNDPFVQRLFDARLPAELAQSLKSGDVEFFYNRDWPIEWKGNQYCVMHDKTNQRIWISCYFNF